MKDLQDDVKGITIGGKNYTSFQYADNAVFVSDREDELQPIIMRLGEICTEYGMEVNVKKMKTMAFSKSGKM